MSSSKYIVIGRFDCERNSYLPAGDIRHVVSNHRTLHGAAVAADRAHRALGGCAGGDMLAQVMERREPGAPPADEWADTYEHAGCLYVAVDRLGGTHAVTVGPHGLVLAVAHPDGEIEP